jgi:hypothetical protein
MIKLVLIAVFVLGLSGCFTMSPTEKEAMSPLYQVKTESYQDIRGDFTVDNFLLYKKTSLVGDETFAISRWNTQTEMFYTARVRFIGSDWRFMETIHLKTDDGLFTFEDSQPIHDVLSGRGGMVEEVVTVMLDDAALASLRTTSMLQIQFFASPIIIPEEGITALHAFLSGQ